MEHSLFKRPHHQKILKALSAFDANLLAEAKCYFAGGTAIAMCLDEYRTSVDIDFLCADIQGFRLLRNSIGGNDLGSLLKAGCTDVSVMRDVRSDQNKIYTVLDVDGTKIKLELVREGRVTISGAMHPAFPVPILSRNDLYTQKLLANDDRGLDSSTMSRDIIDLAMMIQKWGQISRTAWNKAHEAYGDRLSTRFHQAVGKIDDRAYLNKCLLSMEMDAMQADTIVKTLHTAASNLPLNGHDQIEFEHRLAGISNPEQPTESRKILINHLKQAIQETPAGQAVDWATAEIEAASESIFEHNQSLDDAVAAIVEISPGAVSGERQAVVSRYIERNLSLLENAWFERLLHPPYTLDHPPTN